MDSTTNGMATLYGSVDVTATFTDGRTETVKVRQLSIRLVEKLAACRQDEAKAIELYCDKPEGWADTLTQASFTEIITKAEEINRDFFSQWLARQAARDKILPKPDMEQVAAILQVLPQQMLEGLMVPTLPSSSPKPPSAPVLPSSRR